MIKQLRKQLIKIIHYHNYQRWHLITTDIIPINNNCFVETNKILNLFVYLIEIKMTVSN